jgi:hypothetical protein
MSLTETVIEGTLNADGTLELDRTPNLRPGRVMVVLRQESGLAPATEGWWPYMQRVRAEREAAGYCFLNEAEMEQRLRWLRDEDERIDQIYQEMNEEQSK